MRWTPSTGSWLCWSISLIASPLIVWSRALRRNFHRHSPILPSHPFLCEPSWIHSHCMIALNHPFETRRSVALWTSIQMSRHVSSHTFITKTRRAHSRLHTPVEIGQPGPDVRHGLKFTYPVSVVRGSTVRTRCPQLSLPFPALGFCSLLRRIRLLVSYFGCFLPRDVHYSLPRRGWQLQRGPLKVWRPGGRIALVANHEFDAKLFHDLLHELESKAA